MQAEIDPLGEAALAANFERNRDRLENLARRILGTGGEAEEVVQEAWLRLLRGRGEHMHNLGAWLTTAVTRLSLDVLRARVRRNSGRTPLDAIALEVADDKGTTPEEQFLMADSVGVALLVVLDRLSTAERVAFVLHDLFDLPFEDIALLIDRSEEAARQLASRARRRVRGSGYAFVGNAPRHRLLAEQFLVAARTSDMAALLQLLDPAVSMRPDAVAARLGPGGAFVGAKDVASFFIERGAASAHAALIDGEVGNLVAPGDRLLLVIKLTFRGDRIVDLEVIAEPASLREIELSILPEAA